MNPPGNSSDAHATRSTKFRDYTRENYQARLTRFLISKPALPALLCALALVAGVASSYKLPIRLDPDIYVPTITVTVHYPGADPELIDQAIITPLESALQQVEHVTRMESSAQDGEAQIDLALAFGTPLEGALSQTRDALSRVRPLLPQTIVDPAISSESEIVFPLAEYAVQAPLPPQELTHLVNTSLTRLLLGIPGVSRVTYTGRAERALNVRLDPTELAARNVTAVEINQALRNLAQDNSGGQVEIAGTSQPVRVQAPAANAQALAQLPLSIAGGRVVHLSEISTVTDAAADHSDHVLLDGRPAVSLSIFALSGSSEIAVQTAIGRALDEFASGHDGVVFTRIYSTVPSTFEMFYSSLSALIDGALLAVAMVFLFLRDTRATAVAAVAIPLSVIATFSVIHGLGFSLNGISLLALSLMTGVLVDDAIVEVENISVHLRRGANPPDAAVAGAAEMARPVIATSAVLIAVFVPVSFMNGVTGQYYREFGLTASAAALFSLVVARFITPVLAAYLLKSPIPGRVNYNRAFRHIALWRQLTELYIAALKASLKNRNATLLSGVAVLGACVYGVLELPLALTAPFDWSTSFLSFDLPPGARLSDTERDLAYVDRLLAARPEVAHVLETAGTPGDPGKAEVHIALVPKNQRHISQRAWEDQILEALSAVPDIEPHFDRGRGQRDITFYVSGENPVATQDAARQIVHQMSTLPQLTQSGFDEERSERKLVIEPLSDTAARLGVNVASLAESIRIATVGTDPANGPHLMLEDSAVPVVVSLRREARADLTQLLMLPVPTDHGSVPLGSIAKVISKQGPAIIRHLNGERRIELGANLNGNVELGTALNAIYNLPAVKQLPTGVMLTTGGASNELSELVGNFRVAAFIGIGVVWAVLFALFGRPLQPFTIILSLPVSAGGAVLALWITRNALSEGAMIGLLLLFGVVAKNSILLVDRALSLMRDGVWPTEALLDGCLSRARPIVMTSAAMIAGMLPVAAGFTDDQGFDSPMAVAVIGGLTVSTALTLFLVPALFSMSYDSERWLARLLRARQGTDESKSYHHHIESAQKSTEHNTLEASAQESSDLTRPDPPPASSTSPP